MDPDAVWRRQGCFFQWIQAQSGWHGGGNSNAYLQVAESRVSNLESHEKRKCDCAQIILLRSFSLHEGSHYVPKSSQTKHLHRPFPASNFNVNHVP